MRNVIFTVPGEPCGKARPRVVDGHAYTPHKTKAYEHRIAIACRQANPGIKPWPAGTPLTLTVIARCGIPKSATRAQRKAMQSLDVLPTKKPDADNIAKAVADALNGIVYHDDSQIVWMLVCKQYSDSPGLLVDINGPDLEDDDAQ